MDPSYLQFITSLMNDDGFEQPSGSRRNSFGSYAGLVPDLHSGSDEIMSETSEIVARDRSFSSSQRDSNDILARDRAFSLSRDRGFSWDAGFEDLVGNLDTKDSGYTIQDIIHSIGRKRTLSGDVNFNFIPMPVDSYQQSYPSSNKMSSDIPDLATTTEVEVSHHLPHLPDRGSNIEPNFINLVPNGNIDSSGINHMSMQHHFAMTAGMDPNQQLQGVPMQLLRPLMPNMGLSMMDDSNVRVGAYTKEERQIRIAKFRAKKNRRVWKKQIKYDCRKKLADNRPRIKGRFVTRKGGDDEEKDITNNSDQTNDDATVKTEVESEEAT